MNARHYWDRYVQAIGGPAAVATHLDIPYSTIAGVCNGSRGIGRNLARRMARKDPMLDEAKLIWVEPIRKSA